MNKKSNHHVLLDPAFVERWMQRMLDLRVQSQTVEQRGVVTQGPLLAVLIAVASAEAPPQEALQALLEAFEGDYMAGNGEVDLETALLGPVWRNAGNYARRRFKWNNKFEQAKKDRAKTGLREFLLGRREHFDCGLKDLEALKGLQGLEHLKRRLTAWRDKYEGALTDQQGLVPKGRMQSEKFKSAKKALEKLLREFAPSLKPSAGVTIRERAVDEFLYSEAERVEGK